MVFDMGNVLSFKENFSHHRDPLSSPPLLLDLHVDDETRDRIHEGRLSSAVRPDHPDHLSLIDPETQIVNRQCILIKDHEVFYFQHRSTQLQNPGKPSSPRRSPSLPWVHLRQVSSR